jgi:hypothetical protein
MTQRRNTFGYTVGPTAVAFSSISMLSPLIDESSPESR